MSYELTNVSKTLIHENLDTKTGKGKLEVLALSPRQKTTVTDTQFASRKLQRHVQRGRLKVKKLS